jgi:hypothetical protein
LAGITSGILWQQTCAQWGFDIKVAQELLRHANSRTTLDIYTRAVSQQKRDANAQVVEMLLSTSEKKPKHLLAPTTAIGAEIADR